MINFGDLLKEAEKNKNKSSREIREAQKQQANQSAPSGKLKPNAGWLYYKDYYIHQEGNNRVFFSRYFDEIEDETKKLAREKDQARDALKRQKKEFFKNKNQQFSQYRTQPKDAMLFKLDCQQQIVFNTGDKGLLLGTGISHGTGKEGEYKLGLQLDYTTGLPYLPGSSIKGVLRSLFPGYRRTDGKLGDRYRQVREKALVKLLGMIWDKSTEAVTQKLESRVQAYCGLDEAGVGQYFEYLEKRIFEGQAPIRQQDTDKILKDEAGMPIMGPVPMRERDMFFDAYVEKTADALFAEDVITPHKENPLRDPVPLLFLKVAPDVSYQLQFDLHDDALLSAADKLAVFKEILAIFGIGAKRRHGFGELKIK